MSDLVKLFRPTLNDPRHHADVLRLTENRRRMHAALEEIAQGKVPSCGIIEGTVPSYWVIRTETEWGDGHEDEAELSFKDRRSETEFKVWCARGGRGAMLRLDADPRYFDQHVLVRLVNAS